MTRHRLRRVLISRYFAHLMAWFTGDRSRIRVNLRRTEPGRPTGERWSLERKVAQNIGKVHGGWLFPPASRRRTGGAVLKRPGAPAMRAAMAEGRPCILATAHELAIKTDAVLIPSHTLRQPDGVTFRFILEEAIPNTEPVKMMRHFNRRVSTWITEHPGQWFWDIRRW